MDESIVSAQTNGTALNTDPNELKLQELVPELRTKFLDISDVSPEDYDPIDIESIKTNDFQIKRFLLNNDLKTNESFEQLVEAMKWRKSFGILRDFSQFSIDAFQCGGLFIYGQDREGRPILYVRGKTYVKISWMEDVVKHFIVTLLDQLDQKSMAEGKGFAVVMDMNGAGLLNADMGIAKFMITVMRNYFPGSLKSFIVVNLPTILRTFMPLVKLLLGSKAAQIVHTVTGDQIFDYIDRDYVPQYLGGNSTYDFTVPPEECTQTAEQLGAQNNISPKSVRKALKKFEPHMIEAKALVSGQKPT